MAKIKRTATNEGKKEALKHNATFSMDEIRDVLQLVAAKQYPDARFSDSECNLHEMVCRILGIEL